MAGYAIKSVSVSAAVLLAVSGLNFGTNQTSHLPPPSKEQKTKKNRSSPAYRPTVVGARCILNCAIAAEKAAAPVPAGYDGGWGRFNGVRDQTPRPPVDWGQPPAVAIYKSRQGFYPHVILMEALAKSLRCCTNGTKKADLSPICTAGNYMQGYWSAIAAGQIRWPAHR
jgi:hypothetical protein